MVDNVRSSKATGDDNVVKLGSGGRLYRDARAPEPDDDAPEDAPAKAPPQDTGPPRPPWVVRPMQMPAEPEVKTKRDWRQLYSTTLEVIGVSVFSGGLGMLYVWLGVAVFGVCLTLLGVAVGLPPRTGETE